MPMNWCPSCKTGIANEDVVNGRCERCGTEVTKKELNQWMLRITKYADRLLDGLEKLDWPEKVKTMQTNWIGRSEGAEVTFKAIAPDGTEHPLEDLHDASRHAFRRDLHGHGARTSACVRISHRQSSAPACAGVHRQGERANRDIDRAAKTEKTGVFTGAYAINPVNNEKIPIWIADYVLMAYGTGAIMAVPAHDERDYEFAKKFGLEIREVISSQQGVAEEAYVGEGTMMNSGPFTGMPSDEGRKEIVTWLEEKGPRPRDGELQAARLGVFTAAILGRADSDRSLSRNAALVPVDEKDLPVRLPDVERYQPTGTGESPLGGHSRVGECDVSEMRRSGEAGDGHHAAMGGVVVVFPAICVAARARTR